MRTQQALLDHSSLPADLASSGKRICCSIPSAGLYPRIARILSFSDSRAHIASSPEPSSRDRLGERRLARELDRLIGRTCDTCPSAIGRTCATCPSVRPCATCPSVRRFRRASACVDGEGEGGRWISTGGGSCLGAELGARLLELQHEHAAHDRRDTQRVAAHLRMTRGG